MHGLMREGRRKPALYSTRRSATTGAGFLAPARTPAPIVKKLSSEIATIVKLPEVRDALLGANLDPVGGDTEEFARTIANDFKTWAAVAKAANIQINQ